jgi:arylsulfatase A-like enzyme
MTRRELLAGAAAAPLLAKPTAAPRPNVVLVLADGLSAWSLSCYGASEIRTPNIDLLARSGTRFLTHVVPAAASAPGRLALLTGCVGPAASSRPMLSDLLAAQGYQCGFAGKWDLGEEARPQHGFQSWYAGDSGITARALRFLDGFKDGAPFFLVVSHAAPRPPYEGLPQKYYDMYAATPFTASGWLPLAPNAAEGKELMKNPVASLRRAAAGITALDDELPPLVAKLDERGRRDNTIIIFTAPYGNLLGRHGLWGDGNASEPPNLFDDVVATPLIWNWRGKTPPEGKRPELVSSYDLLPTLAEITGAAAPAGLPGSSYLPALMNRPFPKHKPWRKQVFGGLGGAWMGRDERFKVVLRNEGKGPNELYALSSDPMERANQFDNPEFISVRDQLSADIFAWRKQFER